MFPQLDDNHIPMANRDHLERVIIGSLLQDYTTVHIAQSLLKPSDFRIGGYGVIYECILHVYEQQRNVDIITVLDELRARGLDAHVGGPLELVKLTDTIGSTRHFRDHCEIMRDWSMLFDIKQFVEETDHALMDQTTRVAPLLDDMYLKLGQMRGRIQSAGTIDTTTLLTSMWDEIEAGRGRGIKITDIRDLNDTMGGSLPGDLIVVAGRPGSGKSVLTANVVKQAIRDKRHVIMWSLEMANDYVLQRLLSMMASVEHDAIIDRRMSVEERRRIEATEMEIIESGAVFIERSGISAMDIRSELIFRQSTGEAIDTIIIDHGGLLNHINPSNTNSVEEIGHTTKLLKNTAKELNIRVVLLWQLNRQAGKGVIPSLSDLRGSGRIEEDADKVVFVHRPELYNNCPEYIDHRGSEVSTERLVQFIVAKNRRGAIGDAIAEFNATMYQFKEHERSVLPF